MRRAGVAWELNGRSLISCLRRRLGVKNQGLNALVRRGYCAEMQKAA